MSLIFRTRSLIAGLAFLGALECGEVRALDPLLQSFFANHCHDCHGGGVAEGGLDLEATAFDLDAPATFALWERLFDRVAQQQMPPHDANQPTERQRLDFLRSLGDSLRATHAEQKGSVMRRLNRREYTHTLNDLFGTHLDLASRLPEDGLSHEFDNVGETLSVSMVQLERYLESIDAVLESSIATSSEPPRSSIIRASYGDSRDAEKFIGKQWRQLDDGAIVWFKQFGYPSGMIRGSAAPVSGYYDIRVTGYAYQSELPITFSIGSTSFERGGERPTFGYFSMPPLGSEADGGPTTIELRSWVGQRQMIELTPWGLNPSDTHFRKEGIDGYTGPGLAILQVELEGPIVEPFPSKGHHLIYDGLDRREVEPRNPAERRRSQYRPRFEIISTSPRQDAAVSLRRVAQAAFRRSVDLRDLTPFLDLFEQTMSEGGNFDEALRAAVSAIFCSPDFIYLRELPGVLDDHALAARLSYFLTRTAPDVELSSVAGQGRLTADRSELLAQAERLLADERSDRFVIDFTDAWLGLRDIEFTSPDRGLFPEFDPYLQWSMVEETRSFFRELIDKNLPVRNLIRSDFAMINERLAEHYGIVDQRGGRVSGPEIRRVELPEGSLRGGVLSQAAILKVSANGTNTSPVVRGVWVTQRILGVTPAPPPPGVPGVEPDSRGAVTLRQLLEMHRDRDDCRACHALIDPPGFALECFDPIGGYRERFRGLGIGEKVDHEVGGRRVRYVLGPAVDSSGILMDGRSFDGFESFRTHLLEDESAIARAFVGKLLTFATGREPGFSDRDEIERIVLSSAEGQYAVRDLLKQALLSDIFLNK